MRITRIALAGVLVAAIGVPADAPEAAGEYILAYKMDKGTRFAVQVARKHRNHRIFMGNELTTNTEDLAEYGFTVKKSGEDGLRLEIEYTNREFAIDDAASPMGVDFSELIGRKVQVLLSPTGVLSDFKGFGDLPEITVPGHDDPLEELRYTNEVGALFPRFSEAPVAAGGSWTDVVVYDEPIADVTLPLTVSYTYTLIEQTTFDGHDCVKIKAEYTIDLSGALVLGGLDLELSLAGEGTDTIYFAWKKGMLLSSETRANIKGSADNVDMGVTIPMNHDIETITTVSLD